MSRWIPNRDDESFVSFVKRVANDPDWIKLKECALRNVAMPVTLADSGPHHLHWRGGFIEGVKTFGEFVDQLAVEYYSEEIEESVAKADKDLEGMTDA